MRGLGNVTDILSQALFPVPQEIGIDERTRKALQKQSLIQLGLGMMSAQNQGAGLGQGLNAAYQQAQQGIGQGLNQAFLANRSNREDERLRMQDQRMQRYDTRQEEQDRQAALDRATRNAQQSVAQKNAAQQQALENERWERQFSFNKSQAGRGDGPVNKQIITRPTGNGLVQDFAFDPRTLEMTPLRDPYKPVTTYTGNAQESERTAAYLGTRLEDSMNKLNELETMKPGSSTPGIIEKIASGAGSETAANWARGEDRQKANAYQIDALDAALTLATGAAYTKEQLEGQRVAYFPQIGDKPATIAAKKEKLANLVTAARIKAGRSATSIDQALGQPTRPGQASSGVPQPNSLGLSESDMQYLPPRQ